VLTAWRSSSRPNLVPVRPLRPHNAAGGPRLLWIWVASHLGARLPPRQKPTQR
jgi:hypothetical protein